MPVKGETAVQFAGPVDSEVVVGFYGIDEMHGVREGKIFHAEVIDTESECGALRAMMPEVWCERHGFVSDRCQFSDELVESEDAGFFEAVHAMVDFEVDIAIAGDENGVSVIVPDLLRNDGGSNSDVLEACHGFAKVEIFNVEAKVTGVVFGIGNGLLMCNLALIMEETAGELASRW